VPGFFNIYVDAMIMIRGSDKRRMNIYGKYVDKNYDLFIKEYTFLGGLIGNENQIIIGDYVKNEEYDRIFFGKL
jgi:hypothetical protein